MLRTWDEMLETTALAYLNELDLSALPDRHEIRAALLDSINETIDIENQVRPKEDRWKRLKTLTPRLVAMIVLRCHRIVNLDMLVSDDIRANSDQMLLAIYGAPGAPEGIYVSDENVLHRLIEGYAFDMSSNEERRTLDIIRHFAPIVKRCSDPDLIAVNNGVFNYKTKTLEPFSPDKVFICKCSVDYNPSATNAVIHNPIDGTDWDVESWMAELTDDPEVLELLWKLIGSAVRPFVPWNKAAWFYSEIGNNGKGTLCALIKNILGPGSYTTIPLSDFSKDFILESLVRANAIITDENDVGTFVDKAANLKAIITGDSLLINRKFKNSVSYMFRGMMIQCVNELPRVRDKSDSFYRRQLVVPFSKCFTGRERKYIKDDYLKRREVLEYVLFKVLNTDYYDLPVPAVCEALMSEYKGVNDPIRQFAEEMLPRCVWDLLPFEFLYDLYKAWFKQNAPSGVLASRNTFITDLLNAIRESGEWHCSDRRKRMRSAGRITKAEPLIAEYGLGAWFSATYKGGDLDKLCMPTVKEFYNGLLRA